MNFTLRFSTFWQPCLNGAVHYQNLRSFPFRSFPDWMVQLLIGLSLLRPQTFARKTTPTTRDDAHHLRNWKNWFSQKRNNRVSLGLSKNRESKESFAEIIILKKFCKSCEGATKREKCRIFSTASDHYSSLETNSRSLSRYLLILASAESCSKRSSWLPVSRNDEFPAKIKRWIYKFREMYIQWTPLNTPTQGSARVGWDSIVQRKVKASIFL